MFQKRGIGVIFTRTLTLALQSRWQHCVFPLRISSYLSSRLAILLTFWAFGLCSEGSASGGERRVMAFSPSILPWPHYRLGHREAVANTIRRLRSTLMNWWWSAIRRESERAVSSGKVAVNEPRSFVRQLHHGGAERETMNGFCGCFFENAVFFPFRAKGRCRRV